VAQTGSSGRERCDGESPADRDERHVRRRAHEVDDDAARQRDLSNRSAHRSLKVPQQQAGEPPARQLLI
jgi:hypothetical protein